MLASTRDKHALVPRSQKRKDETRCQIGTVTQRGHGQDRSQVTPLTLGSVLERC